MLNESVDDFCQSLVEQAGVLLLPGSLFDHYLGDTQLKDSTQVRNCFRIGFGRKNMPEALIKMENWMR
jgi:aspartate/methionine/tyrosine aminotransferase